MSTYLFKKKGIFLLNNVTFNHDVTLMHDLESDFLFLCPDIFVPRSFSFCRNSSIHLYFINCYNLLYIVFHKSWTFLKFGFQSSEGSLSTTGAVPESRVKNSSVAPSSWLANVPDSDLCNLGYWCLLLLSETSVEN